MTNKSWDDFVKTYGEDTTTNFQLIKWAKELKIKPFYYCMRDEITRTLNNKNTYYAIVNIHKSDQKGVHHSALYTEPENIYFFDSYGLDPTNEIKQLTTSGIKCSTFAIQKPGEKHCGQLSLYVLWRLSDGSRFEDIILSLL